MELHWLIKSIDSTSRLRRWSSVVSTILLRRTCHHRYIVVQTYYWTLDVGLGHQLADTDILLVPRLLLVIARFRSLDQYHEHMKQFTSVSTLSTVSAVI